MFPTSRIYNVYELTALMPIPMMMILKRMPLACRPAGQPADRVCALDHDLCEDHVKKANKALKYIYTNAFIVFTFAA